MSENRFSLKRRVQDGKPELWDAYRQKWIVITPEEEVRQYLAWYIHKILGYPKGWIAMERGIKHGSKTYRFDMVLYKDAQPWVLIECKAPEVKIDQKVFDQVFKYNLLLEVPFLMVSNGLSTYAISVENGAPKFIEALPTYQS